LPERRPRATIDGDRVRMTATRRSGGASVFAGLPARYDRLAYSCRSARSPLRRRAGHAAAAARTASSTCGPAGGHRPGVAAGPAPMWLVSTSTSRCSGRAWPMCAGRPAGPGRLANARADDLPFADGTFDAVTSLLLRYVDDPAATIVEMARCLRLAGRSPAWSSSCRRSLLAGVVVVLHPPGLRCSAASRGRAGMTWAGSRPEHLRALSAAPSR